MRDEIPQWCWYNGMLLFALADCLDADPDKSVRNFFGEFKGTHQLQNIQFDIKNQGLLISLLYGLLVVPKEMWEPRGTKTNFAFNTRNRFTTTPPPYYPADEFLRLLRNAVAHANFEVIIEQAAYRFWNTNLKGERTFEVTVTHGALGEFISEVGKYYYKRSTQTPRIEERDLTTPSTRTAKSVAPSSRHFWLPVMANVRPHTDAMCLALG